MLGEALGAKKLKELRRQRHRLAEHGVVRFEVARTREEVAAALEVFLQAGSQRLESRRGTALIQDAGEPASSGAPPRRSPQAANARS